ncbi:CD9 antigen-like protein [Labeo rohita]|uniref:CD9 antigen-like protein n=1 Tax=Labeo rohita TaxID=84645 RepID=A0A498LPQ4_LABRO|nr:CD9 antigen-like protein [Labeo rohita]
MMCVKICTYSLIFFNILVILVGFGITVLGTWCMFIASAIAASQTGVMFIVPGILMMLVAVGGNYAACSQKKTALNVFSGLIFLLIIANIVAGVVAFTRSGQMSDDLGEFYKKVCTQYSKTSPDNETIALRFIHNTFDCCGIDEPVHRSVRDTCPEGTSKMLALVCSVVLSRLPKQTHGFSPEFVAYWERNLIE